MQTADVVIIGGGIVGASIAWHLTEAGCRDVLIIEREVASGQRFDRQEHGRSACAVRDQAQHPDVAVLHSVLRRVRRAAGPACRTIVRRDICSSPPSRRIWNICSTNQALQKSLGLKNVSMVSARRNRRARAAASLRRHPRRQLLLDRRLCRSQQRDGRLHHRRLRAGREAMALDRGHRHSAQRFGLRGGDCARPGQHEDRGQFRRRVGSRCRRDGRRRSAGRTAAPHAGPHRTVRRRLARDSHGHRYDERIPLPAGEPWISAGVE